MSSSAVGSSSAVAAPATVADRPTSAPAVAAAAAAPPASDTAAAAASATASSAEDAAAPAVGFKKRKKTESAFLRKTKAASGEKSGAVAAAAAAPSAAEIGLSAGDNKADADGDASMPPPPPPSSQSAAAEGDGRDEEHIHSEDEAEDAGGNDSSLAVRLRLKRLKRQKNNPNVQSTARAAGAVGGADGLTDAGYASSRSGMAAADVHAAVDISDDKDRRSEAEKAKRPYGPVKQTSNVRAYSQMDYKPDICKDYKETGYCGFGDNCKFMHDRGDYKSGWQIERDWKAEQDAKRARLLGQSADEPVNYEVKRDDDADLPWACLICREPFTDPVVTQCKHYYCEKCALQRYAKGETKCFACNKQTHGIFQTATRLSKISALRAKTAAEAAAPSEAENILNGPVDGGAAVAAAAATDKAKASASSESGWVYPQNKI